MTLLKTSITPTALWFDIIHEAETNCRTRLNEELEAYLVFLLSRYMTKPDVIKDIIASKFLDGLQLLPRAREKVMQEVGDECLIFSGLFPHIAAKRLVKVSYFIRLGQAAYDVISKKHNDVYHLLAREFVPLMDVLQSIRCYSRQSVDLMPLEAYELWNESGSQRAFKVLSQYSQGVPVQKSFIK